MLYFFPKHILLTEAKSVRNSGNEIMNDAVLEANWQTLTCWHMTDWKIPLVAKNILRIINTIASIWLLKYARIFVLGHYLFLEAHSFPRASLSENCSLLGTDNVRGQISEHIFAPNEGYCLYIPAVPNIFKEHVSNKASWEHFCGSEKKWLTKAN